MYIFIWVYLNEVFSKVAQDLKEKYEAVPDPDRNVAHTGFLS